MGLKRLHLKFKIPRYDFQPHAPYTHFRAQPVLHLSQVTRSANKTHITDMRPLNALSLLVACLPLAFADVKFTVPAAGASVAGGTAFTVTWIDSGSAPSISDLTSYQLFLESGSNAAPQQLYALSTTGLFSTGNTITVTVPITTGGTRTNA